MLLRDRSTRSGPLEPVILADIDDGVEVPVTPGPSAIFPVTPTDNFWLRLVQGEIPGHTFINKFGENPDIDSGSGFEDIWDAGGKYVPPTAPRLHNVASISGLDAGTVVSSGTATGGSTTTLVDTAATFIADGVSIGDNMLNDTNVQSGTVTAVTSETTLTMAGRMRNPNNGTFGSANKNGDSYRVSSNASTGASVMHILGLDATFLSQEEFVVLNGVSNVATVKTWIRQHRARTFGPNTTGAVGTVSSTAQIDGTVSCQVLNGNNQTLMAIFTIPIDKFGHLHKWWGSLSKKQTAVSVLKLRGGVLDGVSFVLQPRAIDNTGSSSFEYDFKTPIPLPGGVDVWIEADSNANDVGVAAGFDIIMIDN